jgi:hypothetical protein
VLSTAWNGFYVKRRKCFCIRVLEWAKVTVFFSN